MKKKRFIIIAVAVLLVIAAAVICFKMFGGSHTGIDDNPESKLSNDSKKQAETCSVLYRQNPMGKILIPVQTGQKMNWIMASVRSFQNI